MDTSPALQQQKHKTALKLTSVITELQFEPPYTLKYFALRICRGVLEEVLKEIKEIERENLIKESVRDN